MSAAESLHLTKTEGQMLQVLARNPRHPPRPARRRLRLEHAVAALANSAEPTTAAGTPASRRRRSTVMSIPLFTN